jgi:inositol phosphorylceramide mannosyltransferase catalytic subunit
VLGVIARLLPQKHAHRVVRIWQGLKADHSFGLLWQALKIHMLRPGSAPARHEAAVHEAEGSVRDARPVPQLVESLDTIPRIIFQTWKTRAQLPANFRHWSATFRGLNPQHTYILWDDVDNREFLLEEFPWFIPYYDGYPREIFRADIVRLFFLFRYGGLYADLDTQCLRSLDPTLERTQLVFGRMGEDPHFEHSVPNALMASAPRQLFWPLAIAMAIERFDACGVQGLRSKGPEYLTGPILVKDAVDYYIGSSEQAVRARAAPVLQHLPDPPGVHAGKITLLEPSAWYPLDWNNPVHDVFRRAMLARRFVPSAQQARSLFPNSALVTYWTHSW